MPRKLAAPVGKSKSGRFPKGNQNCRWGNQISPVMQKVRGKLTKVKSAQELHFLSEQPLSICQKTLSGNRVENREMLIALCDTKLVTAVVLGLTEGATHPLARAVYRAVKRLELQQELEKLDREDA